MGCATPLSNFEAKDNYKDTSDYSIIVVFPLVSDNSDDKINVLVWTTTPWTLPANLMLCVNPTFKYHYVEYEGEEYIVEESCTEKVFENKKYSIVKTVLGSELVGLKYQPPFSYYADAYANNPIAFTICDDSYVLGGNGTGIVHQAPAFGEDDYRVCLKSKVISKSDTPPCPIDENGNYLLPVVEWKGINVKDAEESICQNMKDRKILFSKKKETHPYPFCWRSNTPLIQKVCDGWFINIGNDEIRAKMQKNNADTNWVPQNIRDHRFHNWLGDANDWCVSRNRFWGTPLPLWVSDDGEEVVCISSVKQLETLAGLSEGSVKDLHRHYVDQITIPSRQGKGLLHRVP
jgi:isoleucyl-tRNA synthetase